MRLRLRIPFGAALLFSAIAASGASRSQDADDWDFGTDASKGVTLASVEFGNGASVAVWCQENRLVLLFDGVPASDTETRPISITREGGLTRRSYLARVEGSSLVRTEDARAARLLRAGGQITVSSIAGDARPMRMQFDLPAQSTSVGRVLTACGYPLTDDRDTLPDASDLVARYPRLEMASFSNRYTTVKVELSCIISGDRLTDCRSDHETPSAPEVGSATARRANGALVTLKDGVVADGSLLEIVVTGSRVSR